MYWRILGLGVLFLLWGLMPAVAAVGVHPYIGLTERYNDNLFLEESNEESDLITNIRPGFQLDLDYPYMEGSIDYGLHFLFYLDNDRLDETALSDIQRASAGLTFLPGRDFTVRVEDDLARVQTDLRDEDIEQNESFNRINRNRFEIRPQYRREFRTVIFTVDAGYENVAYDGSGGNDLETYDGGVRFDKRFSPRWLTWVGARYTDLSADDSSDYQRVLGTVGAEYGFGPGWLAIASVSPQWVDFDDTGNESYLGWDAEIRKTLARLSSSLRYSRSQEQSNNEDGSFKKDDFRAAVSISGRWQPGLEVFYSLRDYFNTPQEDTEYGLGAQLRYEATQDLAFWGDARLSWLEYEPENEDITRWVAGVGVDYSWRRIVFALSARYRNNDSDRAGRDYDNTIIAASASWRY